MSEFSKPLLKTNLRCRTIHYSSEFTCLRCNIPCLIPIPFNVSQATVKLATGIQTSLAASMLQTRTHESSGSCNVECIFRPLFLPQLGAFFLKQQQRDEAMENYGRARELIPALRSKHPLLMFILLFFTATFSRETGCAVNNTRTHFVQQTRNKTRDVHLEIEQDKGVGHFCMPFYAHETKPPSREKKKRLCAGREKEKKSRTADRIYVVRRGIRFSFEMRPVFVRRLMMTFNVLWHPLVIISLLVVISTTFLLLSGRCISGEKIRHPSESCFLQYGAVVSTAIELAFDEKRDIESQGFLVPKSTAKKLFSTFRFLLSLGLKCLLYENTLSALIWP